jgi:hypothetical protein
MVVGLGTEVGGTTGVSSAGEVGATDTSDAGLVGDSIGSFSSVHPAAPDTIRAARMLSTRRQSNNGR